jgi:hypothetical protein
MIHAITIAIVAIVAVLFRRLVQENDVRLASQTLVRECEDVLRKAATR